MNKFECWNCQERFQSKLGLFCPHCSRFNTKMRRHIQLPMEVTISPIGSSGGDDEVTHETSIIVRS
jgi:DNA-directed RNA polymerase subunit RPC12/RpoP